MLLFDDLGLGRDRALGRLHELALALHSVRPQSLGSVLQAVDHDKILFGSDWPFANAKVVPEEVRSLTAPGLLSDSERAAIDRGNALALFPRLNPA